MVQLVIIISIINFIIKYKLPIICVIVAILSFLAGRMTTKPKEIVKYVKGETITNTIEVPKYITSTIPLIHYFPTKTDTLLVNHEQIIVQKVDTAKIIENYISERKYAFNVFDNQNGKLDVNQTIQYNELQKFDYSFTPVEKVVTEQKERVFVPFISASYNSFKEVGLGGGIFYHNLGVEVQYLHNLNNNLNGYSGGIKVKF